MFEKKVRCTISDLWDSQCLERELFQTIAEYEYKTANLYVIGMDMEHNMISEACFEEKSEGEYVRSILKRDLLDQIIEHIDVHFLEEVISIPMESSEQICQAIVIRDEGKPYAIFAVLGFVEDGDTSSIPACVRTTQASTYDQQIDMMSHVLRRSIHTACGYYQAQISLAKVKEQERRLQEDYIRSALLTDIVQMLESEEDIIDVVEVILGKVCEHLGVDCAGLYRINMDETTISMIGEWVVDDKLRKIGRIQNVPIEQFPFMKKDSFVISSNTELRPEQKQYMEEQGIKATIVLPVVLEKKIIMYLVFSVLEREYVWDMNTVRFLSDARKIVQSIISKRVAQNSLTSSMASLEDILENIGCGVMVVDPLSRKLLFQNHLLPEDLRDSLSRLNMSTVFEKDCFERELYLDQPNKWIMVKRAHIMWVDDREVELYSVYDITHRKQIEKKIEKSSNSDFLTGLYNRKRCEQDLQALLDDISINGGKGALLFLDLDDFKHINDGLGHQYGDTLLRSISKSIGKIYGIEKNCYRVGGDEFVIIISTDKYERLDSIVNEVENVFSHSWFLKGADYYCTMSMGVCIFPTDANDVEDIMRKADLALYEAKKLGKNQVVFYNDKVQKNDIKRLDVEKYMREACLHPEKEFEVYYQPIIDVEKEGNQCVGAEALVRWNSKELGRMAPSDFIPLAEYLGLIKIIGDYVLREACKACKRWNDMGHPDYKINVNFSVVQLLQNNMKERIKEILDETGLEPHHLTLEVTESLAINDITYMKKLLDGIREYGVRVALDDFGTGYSSLNHIHELPIDVIKVDRCFVENVGKDEYSQVFVKMVSELAKAMGMNVCVEGVEEETQYRAVLKHGVNMLQGYYFAEPIPLREFEIKYVD